MLKKVYAPFLLVCVLLTSTAFSVIDDGIQIGQQFRKKGAPIYLECCWRHPDDSAVFKRSFQIKLMNDSEVAKGTDTVVGSMGITN